MRRGVAVAVLASLLLVAALQSGAAPGADARPAAQGAFSLGLVPVFSGLNQPLFVTHAGDGTNRLFVVERGGTIRVAVGGVVQTTPFLDVRSRVTSSGIEQGLLGLAFHPLYATNGRFFVYYTATDGANTLAAFQVSSDPNRADPTSGQILFSLPD